MQIEFFGETGQWYCLGKLTNAKADGESTVRR